eukprot:GHVH01004656.1.p1 GENE.GHVH01004656.1~~GHVH01004656.1.p1  ORF type:complete len:668 (-),score=84.15 GHVH01004656.1:53-2056(-)
MQLPHLTIDDVESDEYNRNKPQLPSEFTCFLCQEVLNDPVIIDCNHPLKSCSAPSACRSCVILWNERFKEVRKQQGIKIQGGDTIKADPDAVKQDAPPTTTQVVEASQTVTPSTAVDSSEGLHCPACGSLATRLIPNVNVATILGALDITKYKVVGLDQYCSHIDEATSASLDSQGAPKSTVPLYLTQPDSMRAAEYSMTSRDLSIVTSLQRDGVVMVLLGSNEQLRICQRTGYLPLSTSKVFSERLAGRLIELQHADTEDSLKHLFDTCGGHPSCPVLLPGVGDKLGASLLHFFISAWNRGRVNQTEASNEDALGVRGFHLILTVVTGTSISIGGIARVNSVDIGLNRQMDRGPSWLSSAITTVPLQVVKEFSNEYVMRRDRQLDSSDHLTSYGGSLVRQAIADQAVDSQNDYLMEQLTTQVLALQWYMRLTFIEMWVPSIMLPFKSQPFNAIVTSTSTTSSYHHINPPFTPQVAELGGNAVIPAIVAKLRASEASTAGLESCQDRPSRRSTASSEVSSTRADRRSNSRQRTVTHYPPPPPPLSPPTLAFADTVNHTAQPPPADDESMNDPMKPSRVTDNVPEKTYISPNEVMINSVPIAWSRLPGYPDHPYGAILGLETEKLEPKGFEVIRNLQIEFSQMLLSEGIIKGDDVPSNDESINKSPEN